MSETNKAAAAEVAAAPEKQPPSPARELTRQQKAAAIIVSLGTEKASQLYQYMDPEDVEQITLEVAKLGHLDSATTENVLNEYYQMCLTNKAVTEGGLEYARAVLERAFGTQTANQLLEKVTKSLKNREFSFLNKADAKSLYAALQHERPQTIALVLSYVEPEKVRRRHRRAGPGAAGESGGEHRQYGKCFSRGGKDHRSGNGEAVLQHHDHQQRQGGRCGLCGRRDEQSGPGQRKEYF